jgi:hypothetical protein
VWADSDPADALGAPPGLTLQELTRFLEERPSLAYTLYLRNNQDGSPYYAIVAYCQDGALIFGLSGDEDEGCSLLSQLETHASSHGYWSVEEPPASSKAEFLARASQSA